MDEELNNQLVVNNTRAINSLVFQLLATRQALHLLLANAPDPEAIASQFRMLAAQTSADMADEPDQHYLLSAYVDSVEETLQALGEASSDLDPDTH